MTRRKKVGEGIGKEGGTRSLMTDHDMQQTTEVSQRIKSSHTNMMHTSSNMNSNSSINNNKKKTRSEKNK